MPNYILFIILLQLILLVPSFYFYKKLWVKAGIKAYKTFSFLSSILFPILITWIIMNIHTTLIYPWVRSQKFEQQKWKNDESKRYKMVNDVMNNVVLIGTKKEEVIQLLGKAEEGGPCKNCLGYPTHDPEQGFSIDHEVIEIEFDDNDKVKAIRKHLW